MTTIMPLRPIFKAYTREQLDKDFDLNLGIAKWVSISFPVPAVQKLDPSFDSSMYEPGDSVEYETNRYDASYYDRTTGETVSAYIYMDEDSTNLIAIDTVVQSHQDDDARYALDDTPFGNIVRQIQAKTK
jgi:hypothetical protein